MWISVSMDEDFHWWIRAFSPQMQETMQNEENNSHPSLWIYSSFVFLEQNRTQVRWPLRWALQLSIVRPEDRRLFIPHDLSSICLVQALLRIFLELDQGAGRIALFPSICLSPLIRLSCISQVPLSAGLQKGWTIALFIWRNLSQVEESYLKSPLLLDKALSFLCIRESTGNKERIRWDAHPIWTPSPFAVEWVGLSSEALLFKDCQSLTCFYPPQSSSITLSLFLNNVRRLSISLDLSLSLIAERSCKMERPGQTARESVRNGERDSSLRLKRLKMGLLRVILRARVVMSYECFRYCVHHF